MDEMEQSQIEKSKDRWNGIELDRKNRYRRNGIESKARWNGIVLDRIEQREMEWNRTGWNLIDWIEFNKTGQDGIELYETIFLQSQIS